MGSERFDMASEDWAKRVVSALHALGKRHHGGLSHAERCAKVSQSYIRRRKNAGTIDLTKMMAVLQALGEHPARFFRRVFPEGKAEAHVVDVPTGPEPEIVDRANDRIKSARPGSIPRLHLMELDTLRYDEPQKAADRTLAALEFVDTQDVSFALGIWASSQRMLMNIEDATHALLAGLKIADTSQDLRARGDLLQRLATVVSDCGEHAEALTLATQATDAHARAGDLEAVGQTLVDRGEWLLYLGRFKESIAMHRQALPLLARNDDIHRVTAWQDIGLCFHAQGSFEEAAHALREAWRSADSIGILNQSKLAWLEAVIDFSLGDHEKSEEKLCDVVVTFSGIHLGEAALATVDLAEVQLAAGKLIASYASAQAILPFITKLSAQNRVVKAAEHILADLARQGEAAITVQVVGNLRELLGDLKKERHLWRSLRKVT